MTPALYPCAPEDLRTVWPKIRPRLEDLARDGQEDWIPEDVFHELLMGNASLWLTDVDATGFWIVQKLVARGVGTLHLWIACNATASRAHEFWPSVLELRDELGCRQVTFESARRGFDRHNPRLRVRYLYIDDGE